MSANLRERAADLHLVPERVAAMTWHGRDVGVGLPERLARLLAGLVGFGVSLGLMIEARLGLGPWDVLHQGLATRLGIDIGWVVIGVALVALAAWIPLRQRPGIGTLTNAVLVGLVVNLTLDVLPSPDAIGTRVGLLASGVALNAVATALYIGARLGPGPRDGLMTGIAARGHSLRIVRTAVELSVLAVGVSLGGRVGPGTIAYALTIGPLVHWLMPPLDTEPRQPQAHRPHAAVDHP